MIKRSSIHLNITNDFYKIWQEFDEVVRREKLFKTILKNAIKKDKRLENKQKQTSLKVRFAISYCLNELKKKQLKAELGIKDEKTKDRDI